MEHPTTMGSPGKFDAMNEDGFKELGSWVGSTTLRLSTEVEAAVDAFFSGILGRDCQTKISVHGTSTCGREPSMTSLKINSSRKFKHAPLGEERARGRLQHLPPPEFRCLSQSCSHVARQRET